MPEFYTCYRRLLELYDAQPKDLAYQAAGAAETARWQERVREELGRMAGLPRMTSCPLDPRHLETVKEDGYFREKWRIETEPGVFMPFYLLLPAGERQTPLPAVIAPHGHGSFGKEGVAGTIGESGAYGQELVKAGFAVLCPDARGFGERREEPTQEEGKENASSCDILNFTAISLGLTLTGMWVWDLMRLMDFVEAEPRLRSGAACCGFSGGGLQALWFAALDRRVTGAFVSGYMHSYRGTLLRTNLCGCNFVPGLWERCDPGDIAALIAPRPLFIESGREDPLNGEDGIVDAMGQAAVIRQAYAALGAETALRHMIFEGGHRWDGREAPAFFRTLFEREGA
ncbi:MAG: hypothetical protein HFG26_03820 [Provencibacterium sp.]|jgi:pimeloyl-ACP methyl ester carboxylesterase|nr:hypothetical protein [Provencibacterium sp.]